MLSTEFDIEQRLARLFDEIAAAALAAGRRPEEILLLAATKQNDAGRVQRAIRAGVRACGENRVQELLEKDAQGAYEGAELHFIGHLQRNKVRQLVGRVALIHSVDSLALMEEIERVAARRSLRQEILIEVKLGGEENKSGVSPEELPLLLEKAGDFPHLFVRGLMTIPPRCDSDDEILPFFKKMRQLFIDNGAKKYDNVSMDFLSMGMSRDFRAAIACGANIVRIGSALFGERSAPERKEK